MGSNVVEDDAYSSLNDFKLEIVNHEGDVNGSFSLCFWLYLSADSSPFPSTLLRQHHSDVSSHAPFLELTANKEMVVYPIHFVPQEPPISSDKMEIPSARTKTEFEFPLNKWVHIGFEMSTDIIRLHINGEIVGETCATCNFDGSRKVSLVGVNEDDSIDGYVHGVEILPITSSIKDYYVKDPPVQLLVDSSSAADIEEDNDGVWSVVGGKASCRRNFSLEVILIDAFGHSVNKEMEVVASLTYADNGAHVEKPDDSEAPLLSSYDGIEFASWDRPSKLINGRASFKLKISQLSSKCDNRLFRIKFNVPKMGRRYPFLEVFSRSIRCISRNRNTRPSTLIWKRSTSAMHSGSGTSWLDGGSVEPMHNIVHEAKPSPPSKRIKLGQENPFVNLSSNDSFKQGDQEGNKQDDRLNGGILGGYAGISITPTDSDSSEAKLSPPSKQIKLGQGNSFVNLSSNNSFKQGDQEGNKDDRLNGRISGGYDPISLTPTDSDSSEATNSCKSPASNGSSISDVTVFKYCLGTLTEKSLLLKDLANSASEKDLTDFAEQVSELSGCHHHGNQIRISKSMIEEGMNAWNLISHNNHNGLWDNTIVVLRELFMKVSCCRYRFLTQQDFEVLRRIGGCQESVTRENFEKLWCWIYPVAVGLSRNGLYDMWDSRRIEGLVTKEEAESSLQGPGGGLVDPGTFVLRFPTSRSWPHPDAGNLIVTYVGSDFAIHHRLLSFDFFNSCICDGRSLMEMLLEERELSRLGRITRSSRFV